MSRESRSITVMLILKVKYFTYNDGKSTTYPRVVMVTMVYQNDAGIEVKVELGVPFSQ